MTKQREKGRPDPLQRTTVEDRRARLLELAVMGYSTRQIAGKLGFPLLTVQRDLKIVRGRRILDAIVLDDQLAQREISLLRQAQQLAYEGYLRSLKDEVTIEEEVGEAKKGKSGTLKLTKKRTRGQSGSAAYLNVIVSAEAKICEILGLIGKDKFEAATPEQTPKFLRVIVESREQVAEYESLKLEQLKSSNIIEGVATPTAGRGAESK